jgi:type I restriction enzyme S subunit
MKDSGIEWLGEIPEHWEVKKVKWVHQTTSGGTPKTSDPENYDGHIPWLRTLDLNNDNVYDFEIQITEKALSESSAKVVPANSVLVAMYGGAGTIGKSGLLKFNAAINQAICAILPNGITIPEYLHYFVIFFRPYWMVGAEGTRRDPNISQDDIKNKEFIFPPIQEQQSIVHHIESECSKIDFKKARTEELIELLTEYRTALISEAVTGKIKVTED